MALILLGAGIDSKREETWKKTIRIVICCDYVIERIVGARITSKFETTTATCYRTLVNFGLLDNHAKYFIRGKDNWIFMGITGAPLVERSIIDLYYIPGRA